MAAPLRALQALDPTLPYIEIQPVADLLSLFGVLALLLAAFGLYGAIAYLVTRRAHEKGIRMALGADRDSIFALIVRRGLLLAVVRIGVGLGLAILLVPLVQPLPFEVSAGDPWTLAGTSLLVALAASYFPGRRIRRLDPAVLLWVE